MKFYPFLIICIIFLTSLSSAQIKLKLWPANAPGTVSSINKEKIVNGRAYNIYQPSLEFFPAKNPNSAKPAVLIFPGGGYSHVAFIKEGYKVAEWLNSIGISAFVLIYRLNRNEALADAERSIRLIRNSAKEYNINPDNIGVMGFSAGGHLALNLAVHSSAPTNFINDQVDKAKCNPDFLVLGYPQADSLASKRFLKKSLPPVFLFQSADDKTVPIETSIKIFDVLKLLNVPVELHIFDKGGHGFGLGSEGMPDSSWPMLCENWMIEKRILTK